MSKTFMEEWNDKVFQKLSANLGNRKGLTHFELLEYLLLITMVLGIVLVLGTFFSEVQAKIWAKLQNDLLRMN